MSFYFNPLDYNYKSIIGAISNKDNLILNVCTNRDYCNLVLIFDKTKEKTLIKMDKTPNGFKLKLKNLNVGLYFYYFESEGQNYFCNSELLAKNNGIERFFELTVYDSDYTVPTFLNGGIIYQIFPDRFCRVGGDFNLPKNKIKRKWNELPNYLPNSEGKILNNDFFGGNFKGIESKLDYLKSLGVNLIYLNPISLSYSNHRYDTSDYFKIDPLLGTEKQFKELVVKVHEKGIKIILDGVYNHTGDDSVYFNKYNSFKSLGAYQSKNSKYYDWYNFKNFPDDYESWWGIDVLPCIKKNSKSFQEFIAGENGAIDYYMRLGVDGFRLDVVDELSNDFVKKIRKTIKKYGNETLLIGEVWEDASNKIAYDERKEYFLGFELDSVMNYPLKDGIISYVLSRNVSELLNVVKTQLNNYPKKSLDVLMNILSTHDTARILTVLSGVNTNISRIEAGEFKFDIGLSNKARKKLEIALVILYTIYGVPTIYYGDERETNGFKDPFNRTTINWRKKPILIDFYKKLGEIRRKEAVFFGGETEIIYAKNGAFIFKRVKNDEEVIVAVNLGEYSYQFKNYNCLKNLFSNEIKDKFILKKDGWLILKPL